MENDYRQIDISEWSKLSSVVYLLLAYKEAGEHVYCDFNGHKLYSDKVTMDSAYLEVCGKTKAQSDEDEKKFFEEYEKRKKTREEREAEYERRVMESNHGEPVELNQDVIVEGLKFIAEHRDISQDELFDALLEIGCNFTLEDVKREMERTDNHGTVNQGLRTGDIIAGASVICNMRDSDFGRDYGDDRFLSFDEDVSIYNYIRKATGDDSYTQASIEKAKREGKRR